MGTCGYPRVAWGRHVNGAQRGGPEKVEGLATIDLNINGPSLNYRARTSMDGLINDTAINNKGRQAED